MASTLANLVAFISLDNSKFLRGMTETQKSTAVFLNSMEEIGGAVVFGALTAAATAIVGIGSAAFDAAETVDEAFDSIAVATGAQGDELTQLQDDWKAVFTSIPVDAQTAADAIGILNARLGITGKPLQDLTAAMLELTRITGGDLNANAENFTRVIGDWNIPVENSTSALDALFVASQQTGADLATLMQQVVQYGAPMRNFGFSFAESTALLASFAAQGVNTEIVMSGLRIAQGKFISQGKDMNTGLWETVDAIQNAANKTDALAIATEIFGAKAAGDLVDTIRSGKFELGALVEAMQNADGAIMDTANATSDWGETWKTFTNQMTVQLAPLGEKIREAFGTALDQVVEVFNRPDVQTAMTQFADFAVVAIGKLVEYIPIVIDGFFSFVNFLKANEGILIGVFVGLAAAAVVWAASSIAAAASTIVALLPVIAVIALIALAAYLLYEAWTNNWGGIQQIVAEGVANIQTFIQGLIDFFVMVWQNPLVQQVVQTVLANITALFAAFKAAFSGDWYAFGENIRSIWNNNWSLVVSVIQSVVPTIINKIKEMVSNVISVITNTNWLELGKKMIEGIAKGMTGAIGLIATAAKNVATAAVQATKGFLGIKSPSKLFEDEVGTNMGLGLVRGWENILSTNPFTPALASATVDLQPAAAAPFNVGAQPQSPNDANSQDEELKRMLRELPADIARAVRDGILKMQRK